jgi:hypothetical protein
LREVYPEAIVLPPKLKVQPPSVNLDDVKSQREFFDNLAVQLGVKNHEDWATVAVKNVVDNGGYFVNSHYNGSLIQGTLY